MKSESGFSLAIASQPFRKYDAGRGIFSILLTNTAEVKETMVVIVATNKAHCYYDISICSLDIQI